MTTRRERLERKLELRQEWAEKAEARSESAYNRAHAIGDMIPMGQPILVGHHSEKRHRRDLDRIDSNMRKSIENSDLAKHHESKAAGIESALDRSIFSDDDNAVEALEARIAEHEAERERMKTINKLYRKGDAEGLKALGIDIEELKAKLAKAGSYWGSAPHLPYELSNLGGRITADRKRLEHIKRTQEQERKVQDSEQGIIIEDCSGGYVRVTFAEKPSRDILDILNAATFHWSRPSWYGLKDKLPEEVRAMAEVEQPGYCTCDQRSWYGDEHDTACEMTGKR